MKIVKEKLFSKYLKINQNIKFLTFIYLVGDFMGITQGE